MKNTLALLAIGLWVITVAVLGTMFVRGSTAPGLFSSNYMTRYASKFLTFSVLA